MTVWPLVDAFDEGSPVYGDEVRGYIGVRLVDSSAWRRARLHAGYGVGLASASGKADDPGHGTATASCGFMRRQEFTEDVRVELVASKLAVTGQALSTDLYAHGVLARIRGGTADTATLGTTQRWAWHEDCTCYAFTVEASGTPGKLQLAIRRWDAGVPTDLVVSDEFDATAAAWTLQHRLRLEVTTDGGGDVLLVGSVEVTTAALQGGPSGPLAAKVVQPGGDGQAIVQAPGAGIDPSQVLLEVPADLRATDAVGQYLPRFPIGPPGGGEQVVDLLTVTDPAVSALTGGGRCGFILDPEFFGGQGGADPIVSLSQQFTVAALSGGVATVAWQDDWLRAWPVGQLITDLHGTTGRGLGADYSTDNAGLGDGPRMTRDTGTAGQVTQEGIVSLGDAPDMLGNLTSFLTLADPTLAMPLPAGKNTLRVSVAVWVNPDALGPGLAAASGGYTAMNASNLDGLGISVVENAGDAALRIDFAYDNAIGAGWQVDIGPKADFIGQTWCLVLTYAANIAGDGSGRVRGYVGRFGQATLYIDEAPTSAQRPNWPMADPHRIGNGFSDGRLDRVAVFYDELTEAEVAKVCTESTTVATLQALGAVHVANLDSQDDGGTTWEWPPDLPAGVTDPDGKWVAAKADVGVGTGLVPDPSDQGALVVASRPPESEHDHERAVTVTLPDTTARCGLLLRGQGAVLSVLRGYVVKVLAGSPAQVQVLRYEAGAASPIGRQSAGSTAALPLSTPTVLRARVQRLNPSQPDSAALITASLGGTTILLEPDPLAPDVGATTTGALVDSAPILAGAASGLLVEAPSGSPVGLDDWTVILPTTTPGPSTAPVVVLPAESDNATGNLNDVLDVDWEVTRTAGRARRLSRMEDERPRITTTSTYERRRYRLRRVSLGTSAADLAIVDAFEVFWRAHVGAGQEREDLAFTWQPPAVAGVEEPAGLWFFENGEQAVQQDRQGRTTIEFDVVEAVG